MPETRLRTFALTALASRQEHRPTPSSDFQGASFIHSPHDVQTHDETFNPIGGHADHHYAERRRALSDVLRAVPDLSNIQADILSRATAGTGQGFLESGSYQTWKNSDETKKTLWGRGELGAGKTIQASIVINDLETRAKASDGQICVAYVYLRPSEDSEITFRSVLEVLIKQTVERHPQCYALAEQQYDQHLQEDTEPTERELLDLMAHFTRVIPVTFYIIEALNEAPTAVQLSIVRELSSLDIKLFITSRPLPAVEESVPNAEIVEITAQDHDIGLFIYQQFERGKYLPGVMERGGPTLSEEILATVKRKSAGNFLYAYIHLDALHECISVWEAQQSLLKFSLRMEDAYKNMWRRILALDERHVPVAKTVILWVVYAPHLMSVAELQHAMCTSPETFEWERGRMMSSNSLIKLGCDLLTIDQTSHHIRLFHYTAKQHLKKFLLAFVPHPHARLANVCLTHLITREFPNSSINSEEDLQAALAADPLLAYAYRNWAYHCLQSLDDQALAARAKAFIESCQSYPMITPLGRFDTFHSLQLAIAFQIPLSLISASVIANPNQVSNIRKLSPLAVAAIYGNNDAAEHLLALPNIQINVADADGRTELHHACQGDRTSIVENILRQPNAKVNGKDTKGWTPLMRACSAGSKGCVKLLLASSEIDINAVDNRRRSALITAAIGGYDAIVELLLAGPDVEPNLADEDGWTALMHAAAKGNESSVGHILAHPKVDVNHLPEGSPALSALMVACLKGKEGIARLLLADARTDHHLKNEDKISALLLAADQGLAEIVALIASSAPSEVHQPGFKNMTALMAAAAQGHAEVVKILLALPGADVNAVDDNEKTAIIMAAESGNKETVRLLLDVPGINAKGREDGERALSAASNA